MIDLFVKLKLYISKNYTFKELHKLNSNVTLFRLVIFKNEFTRTTKLVSKFFLNA